MYCCGFESGQSLAFYNTDGRIFSCDLVTQLGTDSKIELCNIWHWTHKRLQSNCKLNKREIKLHWAFFIEWTHEFSIPFKKQPFYRSRSQDCKFIPFEWRALGIDIIECRSISSEFNVLTYFKFKLISNGLTEIQIAQ